MTNYRHRRKLISLKNKLERIVNDTDNKSGSNAPF